MAITGLMAGANEQRAANTNYLAQLDQMQRAAVAQALERKRMEDQAAQFQQQLAATQMQHQMQNQLEQQRLGMQQSQFGQEFGLRQSADQRAAEQARQQGLASKFDLIQKQQAFGARNALADLVAQNPDMSTKDIALAYLSQGGEPTTGIGFLKAAKEEERQQNLLDRTGGTGIQAAPGYRWNPKTGNQEFIPGGSADPAIIAAIEEAKQSAKIKEKPLQAGAVKELGAAGAAIENTERLKNTFQDQYGGHSVLGDFSNTYKRVMGDATGQAQWWQDMEALQNQARHELFGSALTAGELAAWNKANITPRMDPEQIRENLQRRSEIEARAASKLGRAYAAGGYSEDQIRELLGTSARYLDNPAPPATQGIPAQQGKTAPGGKIKFLGFE